MRWILTVSLVLALLPFALTSARAEDDTPPTVASLQAALRKTQQRVDDLEAYVGSLRISFQSLQARVVALERGQEARAPVDATTQVYTLDRVDLERRLRPLAHAKARKQHEDLSEEELAPLLRDLDVSMRKELQSYDVRIELRADRSAQVTYRTPKSTYTLSGLWSQQAERVVMTLTQRDGKPQPLRLVEAKRETDALEIPPGDLPFPIRVRKVP